jgi:hypothetical protein
MILRYQKLLSQQLSLVRMRVEVIYDVWLYSSGVKIREPHSENRRKGLFVNFLATVTVCSIFLAVFISSYFNWSITSIVSYPTQDGWCEKATTGIGEHCFGDFFAPVSISSEQPWGQGLNPNPPTAMNIFRLFWVISEYSTPQVALIVWLIAITFCLFFPLVHISRERYLTSETKWKVIFIYALSSPLIVSLDRGNIICLTVPLMYLFLMKINSDPKWSLYLLVLAALIKPQLIIFAVLVLKVKGTRLLVKTLGIWLGSFFLAFFTYGNFGRDLSNYISAVSDYSNYATRGKIYPVNLSLRNTLDIISSALGQTISEQLITVVAYGIIVIFLTLTLLNINRYSYPRVTWNLTLILVSFIGTSFSYYSIFVLLVFVVIVTSSSVSDIFDSKIRLISLAVVFTLLLPMHTLSWKLLPIFREFGQTQISMTWSLGQTFILLYIIIEICLETKKTLANSKIFLSKRVKVE